MSMRAKHWCKSSHTANVAEHLPGPGRAGMLQQRIPPDCWELDGWERQACRAIEACQRAGLRTTHLQPNHLVEEH